MKPTTLIITNGQLITPTEVIPHGYVCLMDGRITSLGAGKPPPTLEGEYLDVEGAWVSPGFIDIHVNGGGGSMAIDGTKYAIQRMSEAHARFGTTSMLPTTISASEATMQATLASIAAFVGTTSGGARVLGAHVEGPFLSANQAGAHRKDYLRQPTPEYFEALWMASEGTIRLLSLAPELNGALDLIAYVRERRVAIGLAHSEATFEVTRTAIARGLSLCTHLFNAMPPFTHRNPGPIGAFLTTPTTYIELIADGFHVHPAALDIAIQCKGIDQVILITDAISAAATDLNSVEVLGMPLFVRDKSCFTADGKLAGSALTMNFAVRYIMQNTRASLIEAIRMATLNPATFLGIQDRTGSLSIGKEADLVILEQTFDVRHTIIAGQMIYSR